nr:hypothetical protein [Chloroflexia bacterium]
VGRRESLPAAVEQEARHVALDSWPVSLALARYYALRDIADADVVGLATRFAALAAVEPDGDRLRSYGAEAAEMAHGVARRRGPRIGRMLAGTLADRFGITPKPKRRTAETT